MNPEDHIDHSKWSDFLDKEVVFFATSVIDKMIEDLLEEKNARKTTEKLNANY